MPLMSSRFTNAMLAFACFALHGLAVRGANLFEDKFDGPDGPPEGWLVYSGNAEVVSNELLLQSPLELAGEVWTWIDTDEFEGDISIQFDITFDPSDATPEVGRHGGVMFFANEKTARYSGTMTGYVMDWIDRTANPNDYGFRFHKWANGGEVPMVPDGSAPDPDIGTTWRITASGSNLVFESDGEVKALVEESEYRLGSIGFWGWSNGQHIHIDNVIVTQPPEASFTATPPTGPQPLTVSFDASASRSPDGSITAYEWEFGDGGTASGVKVSHTYQSVGSFKVQLKVTDSRGITGFGATQIQVNFNSGDVSPWQSVDVGTVAIAGGARLTDGDCISVFSSGKEIALAEDHFHFVYQEQTGDTSVTTRVKEAAIYAPGTRGGVMLRGSLDPASAFAMMAITPTAAGLRTVFLSRKADGGRVAVKSTPALTLQAPDALLRVERVGAELIGSASPDGVTWTEITRITLDVPVEKMLGGLALNANDKLDEGLFSNFVFCETKLGGGPPTQAVFHRGDVDSNGTLQLTDAVRVLGYLFLGQEDPPCFDAADADDNGQLQLTDAVRILGFLFLGAEPPASPGPPGEACGPDPTKDDGLECSKYEGC